MVSHRNKVQGQPHLAVATRNNSDNQQQHAATFNNNRNIDDGEPTLTPRRRAARMGIMMSRVPTLSQPWSKSWPRGLLLPVRRACLPSMASRVW